MQTNIIMKKISLALLIFFISTYSFAQTMGDMNTQLTKKDAWLKAGLEAGIPVGDVSNFSSFDLGGTVSGQFMDTKHFGVGIVSGYTQFFAKNGAQGFGDIPLGLMLRYYSHPSGLFAGIDLGYSFLTNTLPTGGFYMKPQAGYHNYSWNFYAFYNQVFTNETGADDVQNVGIAAVYNIHFK
jgi:hypothetical protein